MNIIFQILICLSCDFIGGNEDNNKYYSLKKTDKRFIIFDEKRESSKIPQIWHAWAHKISSKLALKGKKSNERKKKYLSNLTVIAFALKHQGNLLDKNLNKSWQQIVSYGHLENNYEI